MVKIILSGCNGKMGKVITSCAEEQRKAAASGELPDIIAGIDRDEVMLSNFPVFSSFGDLHYEADVIIDFSHPSMLDNLLGYAVSNNTSAVLCTTGYSDEQIEKIKAAAEKIPVFFSFNMSLGVNLLAELAKKAAAVLTGFDIEIVEAHHNQKIDAPSGTALMLANEINAAMDNKYSLACDRSSRREQRPALEIGMHSIRGGTIVGDHDIIFAGRDEVVTLSHSAKSKEIFAVGALRAALFLSGKVPGLYTMSDMIM